MGMHQTTGPLELAKSDCQNNRDFVNGSYEHLYLLDYRLSNVQMMDNKIVSIAQILPQKVILLSLVYKAQSSNCPISLS